MPFKNFQHNLRIFGFSLKIALRSMRYRSFRTFLTVLGITIGITTFVSLMSIGVGMRSQVTQLISQFMGSGMMVSSEVSSQRPSVPEDVGIYLKEIEGVNDTVGVIEDFVEIGGEYVNLGGVPPDKLETTYGITIIEGHNLQWGLDNGYDKPVIIDESARQTLGYDINDTFIVSSMMNGIFMEFTIVGISSAFQIDISFIMAGFAYTTLDIMQEYLVTDNVQYFMVTIKQGYDMNAIVDAIREAYPAASVTTSEEIQAMSDQIMNIMFAVLLAIGSISLLVGALMITNTTMMSVLERTREIGIVKSIGGKRSHVLTIFMTESVLIASIGGILGCILSIIAVLGLTGIVKSSYGFPLAYSFESWIFIAGIGLAAGIGAIAGAFPSWRAASVKPVEALRYE
ncbi:MAG TPA: ABC transporter permease [Candidatus Deferrimicrobium sp.]|nr:ABC transporter permease [Candidatus Deferrimicrobium sp.]